MHDPVGCGRRFEVAAAVADGVGIKDAHVGDSARPKPPASHQAELGRSGRGDLAYRLGPLDDTEFADVGAEEPRKTSPRARVFEAFGYAAVRPDAD